MKVAIGADHGGFELKKELVTLIGELGHEAIDMGAYKYDGADDYPDLAAPVAAAVRDGKVDRGIILCGSGVGASVAANKFRGVRAAVCHDTYSAAQGVQHDDMNVLCLGARVIGSAVAAQLTSAFLNAKMDSDPRFKRRLDKVIAIEARELGK